MIERHTDPLNCLPQATRHEEQTPGALQPVRPLSYSGLTLCAEPLVVGWPGGPGLPRGPSNGPLSSLPLTALRPACKASEGVN